jgi:2-polyprenyl-3-methyl-5-hydroxy-6-metoxy-1,4-benzoquinol methylase
MAHPALAIRTPLTESAPKISVTVLVRPQVVCPLCMSTSPFESLEDFYSYSLYECGACRLQFWEPRKLPDAHWYSAMYGERDSRILPLEPGHRFFLADTLAPRCGRLLDVGCGTGNFLLAATQAGYTASGIELDSNAARFAARHCPHSRIFAQPLEAFRTSNPSKIFDIVTFFEVLEHQSDPSAFLAEARECLRPRGFVALSVPNRERWQTSMDALDYPPNHFLRWNSHSLQAALKAHGFSVLSIKKEKATLGYAAQQINNKLRLGISRRLAPDLPKWFRDQMQEDPEQLLQRNGSKPSRRTRAVQMLGRAKHAACFPVALAAIPYVRWRRFVGPYLYCLARRLD